MTERLPKRSDSSGASEHARPELAPPTYCPYFSESTATLIKLIR